MDENEKIKRRQGEHYKKNKIKTAILMYILKADGAVSGSEIRRYLNKEFGIEDNKNIKNHLEKLRNEHCIEKFELVGDDFGNKWDITKLENLINIDKLFPKIPQNEYNKCLSLLPFEETITCLNCLNTETLRFNTNMSRGFYDVCLKGDFKDAYNRTKEYFRFTEEGHEPELMMNKQLNDNFYVLRFLEKVLESSTSKTLEEISTIKEAQRKICDEISEKIFKVLLENQSIKEYTSIYTSIHSSFYKSYFGQKE